MANAIIKTAKAYKTTPISKMRNQILKKINSLGNRFGSSTVVVEGLWKEAWGTDKVFLSLDFVLVKEERPLLARKCSH